MKRRNWLPKKNLRKKSWVGACLCLALSGALSVFSFMIFPIFAEDVSVNVIVSRPPVLGSQAQYKPVEIANGGWTNETSLIVRLNMSDLDIGSDTLIPCVEIRPLGTSFTNTATNYGAAVAWGGSGSVVGTVAITGLVEGSYHWQGEATDAISNSSGWGSERTLTVDTTAPAAPTSVVLTSLGGTVVSNTLNTASINFTVSATIVAGQAIGGSAELLKGGVSFGVPIIDTNIAAGDTSVVFDAGFTTNSEVQAAFANGAILSVKLTDAAGNFSISSVNNPTIVVDYATDYQVKSAFVYDENTKGLTIRVWLEKSNKLVFTNTINKLGLATIEIFDESTDTWFNKVNISVPGAGDSNGIYKITVQNVLTAGGVLGTKPLVAGKSYYARCRISYGGTDGMLSTYESSNSFTISDAQSLKTVTDTMNTAITGMVNQTSEIKNVVKDEIQRQIETVIVPQVTDIRSETAKILTATGTESLKTQLDTAKSAIVSEIQPHVTSGILNSETTVKLGGKMNIRYRTVTGLAPVLNVYSQNDVLLLSSKLMTEIGATGIYEYNVTFLSGWGLGSFTVICSEPAKGTVDALVITVTQSNLEDVSGQVSAVLGSTSGLSGKNITAIGSQFSDMDQLLVKINKDVTSKLGDAKSAVSELANAFKQLEVMSKQIKDIGGTTGINLEKLYEVSKDKKEDILYIKNKSEELKAAMELNQKMIENVGKKPVVQSWFEFK